MTREQQVEQVLEQVEKLRAEIRDRESRLVALWLHLARTLDASAPLEAPENEYLRRVIFYGEPAASVDSLIDTRRDEGRHDETTETG